PQRDRQPAGQHEQQHAVGDAVEENSQHGRSSSPLDDLYFILTAARGAMQDRSRPPLFPCPPGGFECRAGPKGAGRKAFAYFFIFNGSLTASNFANSTL